MVRSLPQRLLYEIGGAAYFFKLGTGTAFIKAKIDAVRQLRSALRKRSELRSRRILTNAQLRLLMQNNWLGSKWEKFSSAWRGSSKTALRTSRLAS
jgi:hypothetical protein